MGVQEILAYLKIIQKWWWVVALLFVTTVGTMAAIAFLTEPQYRATVTILVSAPPPQETPLFSDFGRSALRDEIQYTKAGFSELLLEGDVPYRILETLPDVNMSGGELRDRIEVENPEGSQLLNIRVLASDPEMAALLANAVAEVGLEQYGQLLARPTASTREFIEREFEAAREELRTAEAELTQFQIQNKIGNLNNVINYQYELLEKLREAEDLAKASGQMARAQGIEEAIMEREFELQNLLSLSAEYNDLSGRVARVRSTHNFLLSKMSEARIKENQLLELGSIQIITKARPPSRPVAAISIKLVALGAVGSILTGVLLTFLLEYLKISSASRRSQSDSQHTERPSVAEEKK